MNKPLLPSIFTVDIDGKPTLSFRAQNLHEANEISREQWFKLDLAEATSNGVPLWDGKALLRTRIASEDEITLFMEAAKIAQTSEQLIFAYLVEIDGQ